MSKSNLHEITKAFTLEGHFEFFPATTGYINDTYLAKKDEKPVYVIQRINSGVFEDPEKVQFNADLALKKLKGSGYHEMQFLLTPNSETLYKRNGKSWRIMDYVPGSQVFQSTKDPGIAYEAGRILGRFHALLKNEEPRDYYINIPDFHDLGFRFREFSRAVEFADHLTLMDAQQQMNVIYSWLPDFKQISMHGLPLRVCHNDSKLNNILYDQSGIALCLIDLDTIMPGIFAYDFGDLARTLINPASEDETDLKKVGLDLKMYEAMLEGIKNSGVELTKDEKDLLPLSAGYMPFLHGMRALSDFLNGNIYYKINYAEHNLDRAKNLLRFTKLVKDNQAELEALTRKILK